MKAKLLPIGLFLLSASVQAQEVISSQGDSFNNGTVQLDFTIGEPIIETASNGNNVLTQGFHQPNLMITKIKDVDASFLVNIFPNPTTDLVSVSIEKFQGYSLQLLDVSGKLIIQQNVVESNTVLNFKEYLSGEYILILTDEKNKQIKTYQIIKA